MRHLPKSDRIKFISFLQILGVILVIVFHSFHEYPSGQTNNIIYRIIETIHMPLFVFISGYLFNFSRQRKAKTSKDFVIGKCKRVLVPYFFLGAITFVPRALMSAYADDVIELSWSNFFKSFIYSDCLTIVYFWFLPAIFIMLNFMFFSLKAFRRFENIFLLIMAAITTLFFIILPKPELYTFLAIGKTLKFFIFFILGCLFANYQQKVTRLIQSPFATLILMICWVAAFYFIEGTTTYFFCSVVGTAMCVSLSLVVAPKIKYIWHLEGFSYMMYLLSWYTTIFCQQVLHSFTRWEWWVYTILAIITSIYIPWSIGKILQHYAPTQRWARICLFLLGHDTPKKPSKILESEN